MRLSYENLVIVTRPADRGKREVLVGRKLRGAFTGYKTFPGGKEEGNELGHEAASRELNEETGIFVPPENFAFIGRIIVADWRKNIGRFGAIELFHTEVPTGTDAKRTEELQGRWEDADNPNFTANMPPDVQAWWPYVKGFDPGRLAVHLAWYENMPADADPYITVKEPGYGEIFYDDHPS